MTLNLEEKKKKVLDSLILLWEWNVWELAKPLAILVHSSKEINLELLDAILEIVDKAMNETTDIISKEKFQKAKIELEWMIEIEKKEREKEMLDAENLFKDL